MCGFTTSPVSKIEMDIIRNRPIAKIILFADTFSHSLTYFKKDNMAKHENKIYIFVAKHGKLKLINHAMIVKHCKITQDIYSKSHGRETHAYPRVIHLTTFKYASLLRVHKTLQDVHTNV